MLLQFTTLTLTSTRFRYRYLVNFMPTVYFTKYVHIDSLMHFDGGNHTFMQLSDLECEHKNVY